VVQLLDRLVLVVIGVDQLGQGDVECVQQPREGVEARGRLVAFG
jgi:hypothetical protein